MALTTALALAVLFGGGELRGQIRGTKKGSAEEAEKIQKFRDTTRKPRPAGSAEQGKGVEALRAKVVSSAAAAMKAMEKEGLSENAREWVSAYVNKATLRESPLLEAADYEAAKRMLSRDEVKKWIAAEDSYVAARDKR